MRSWRAHVDRIEQDLIEQVLGHSGETEAQWKKEASLTVAGGI